MISPARSPYDAIARYYRFLFDDWEAAVAGEGLRIETMLRPHGVRSVLDVTCGTGLQCIGLAQRGFEVTGCDSSAAMLREARRNARQSGAKVRFIAADVTSLPGRVRGEFDAAISLGNSLSHLSTERELNRAFEGIFSILGPGGVCLVDAWDYEAMFRERPAGVYNTTVESEGKRIVMYDTRSYGADSVTSTFNVLRETNRGWKAIQTVMELRAWRKDDLVRALRGAGFAAIADLTEGETVQIAATKA